MLILSRSEVERLLDLDRLVEALASAMVELSSGSVSMPPRVAAVVPEREAFLGVMPAHVPGVGVLEAKLVSVFPHNDAVGLPSHQAVIVAFDPTDGRPLALMDATHITAARTAAGSALATRTLARPEAPVLAVLGTGVQARAHARAVSRVREISELRVAGRDQRRAEALAAEIASELGLPATASGSFEAACRGADVVCATTHAVEPVVRREWLQAGVHVNSVGFNPAGHEVAREVVADALVVVESRDSALAPPPAGAPDLAGPLEDGSLKAEDVPEIGEILAGDRPGRTSPDQITLYRSVGVAVQDAVAAALVLQAAREQGAGLDLEI